MLLAFHLVGVLCFSLNLGYDSLVCLSILTAFCLTSCWGSNVWNFVFSYCFVAFCGVFSCFVSSFYWLMARIRGGKVGLLGSSGRGSHAPSPSRVLDTSSSVVPSTKSEGVEFVTLDDTTIEMVSPLPEVEVCSLVELVIVSALPTSLVGSGAAGSGLAPVLCCCPRCRTYNSLTRDGPHGLCLTCLGPYHDMWSCASCAAMQLRTRIQRARCMLLWRKGLSDHSLSRKEFQARRQEFETFSWFQGPSVLSFLGVAGGTVKYRPTSSAVGSFLGPFVSARSIPARSVSAPPPSVPGVSAQLLRALLVRHC